MARIKQTRNRRGFAPSYNPYNNGPINNIGHTREDNPQLYARRNLLGNIFIQTRGKTKILIPMYENVPLEAREIQSSKKRTEYYYNGRKLIRIGNSPRDFRIAWTDL